MDSEENAATASYQIIEYKGVDLPSSYRNMVFSKFLRSLRFGNDYFKLINQPDYFSVYHLFIESLLNRPAVSVRLAVLSDDSDVVLGWAMVETGVVHYCYVNKENRRIGIGRVLCDKPFNTITHLTYNGAAVWNKLKGVVFNPFR